MLASDFALPPNDLLRLITGIAENDPAEFLRIGAGLARRVRTLVKRHGGAVETSGAMLDFGCGCGRTIRHFVDLRVVRLHGTDYDKRLIDWCQAHLPFAAFAVNESLPPLDYPSGMFGVVYAFSVFTHFTPSQQTAWMAELLRVLVPGGFLVVSTQGAPYAHYLPEPERARFEATGAVVVNEDRAGEASCMAYHSRDALARVAAGFDLLEHRPGQEEGPGRIGQDVSILRKPA